MVKILKVLIIAVIVGILSVFFAGDSFLSNAGKEKNIKNMAISDFSVTLEGVDQIVVENLIKGEYIKYSWIIENTIKGKVIFRDNYIAKDDLDRISFTYEKLSEISIQAIVEYKNSKYISDTYGVSDEGKLVLIENTAKVEPLEIMHREINDIVSVAFLVFLLVTTILYYLVPKKNQRYILLGASLFFYTLSGTQYIIFILSSSIVIWKISCVMSKRWEMLNDQLKNESSFKEKKRYKLKLQKENRYLLLCALMPSLGIMCVIKYMGFAITNINTLSGLDIPMVNLVMPLGLSFYTFILIAYIIDIARGKYHAEERLEDFLLFVTFFPQVSQGPISRFDQMMEQYKKSYYFNYENFCKSCQRILWGFFIKLVLADRIAIFVNAIYDNYTTQSWLMLFIGTMAYSIQIYADFYSSMEIAIGAAQLFGIELKENFLRPYFAKTMPEFWRRWHVTLGEWFKEYVFYPISLSKYLIKFSVWSRKKFGFTVSKIVSAIPPIMSVWFLTGLWHGASWSFIAWGMFHGSLILLSTIFSENIKLLYPKLGIKQESWDYKVIQMIKVFILCTIGRVFFKTNSLMLAFEILKQIFTFSVPQSLISFEIIDFTRIDYQLIIFAIVALFVVSTLQEKNYKVREVIGSANIWIRWIIWIILIVTIIVFGIYGPGTAPIFIYENF